MKLTPARFIQSYARLGVCFELRNGVVLATGGGVSPLFAECVVKRSAWLLPVFGLPVERVQVEQPSVRVESTNADRLIWDGIQNARKAEAKVKAIKGRGYT